jgi:hypothetical protein
MTIFAAMVAGIYRLLRFSTDRFTATAAGLTTLLLFGFSRPLSIGNYNFVTPYSHEATHGMALSVATLLAAYSAIAKRRRAFTVIGGLCFGLLLLTKPETPLAAAAGVIAGWIGSAAIGKRDRHDLRSHVPMFVLSAALPAILFFAYFRAHMESADALRAIGGAWVAAIGSSIARNQFYVRGMGLDHPIVNLLAMALMFLGIGAFVAAAIAISRKPEAPSSARDPRRLGRVVLLIAVIGLARLLPIVRALPLVTLTGLAAIVVLFVSVRRDRSRALELLPLVMWSAFGLVLLAKMGLNARFVQYGFYLALPATTVGVVLLCWLIPRHLETIKSSGGREFRWLATCALAATIAPYLGMSNAVYRRQTLAIGAGGDRFYVSTAPGEWQGAAVKEALDDLARLTAPGDTVAVLPEGVMLNYLARRDSPLRVVNLMPPEVLAFGEEGVLRSLEQAPPDLVLLVHKDVAEYGYPPFGSSPRYGERIITWVRPGYRVVRRIGRPETSQTGFGIEILARKQEY